MSFHSAIMVKKKPDLFPKIEQYHKYSIRNSSKLHVNHSKSILANNGTRYISGGKILNKLSQEITSTEDITTFKIESRSTKILQWAERVSGGINYQNRQSRCQ